MKETVIITGAGGFVGGYLTKSLIEQGFSVIAVDLNTERLANFKDKNLTVLEADFTDTYHLKNIADKAGGSCYLIHLGGYVLGSVKENTAVAIKPSVEVNIIGSYNLVSVLKPKLTGVCIASTLDVYGAPRKLPITEEHLVAPDTFYAVSKFAAEQYVRILLEGRVPLAILRFSHIYGQGNPHAKALLAFINAVNSGNNPVIYGDGSDLRDYIHISDIAEVIISVFCRKKNGVFNAASGRSLSLRELAELVIRISGRNLFVKYKERQQDKRDYLFDISKIERELCFSCQISLEEGIKELINIEQ